LRELLFIISDIILLTDSKATDESKLHIYRELLDSWLTTGEHSVELASVVESFGLELKLTTGQSMTLIWERYRTHYPSTHEAWQRFNRVVDISKRFDVVSINLFPDALDSVDSLRQCIIEAMADVLSGDNELQLDGIIEVCSPNDVEPSLTLEFGKWLASSRRAYIRVQGKAPSHFPSNVSLDVPYPRVGRLWRSGFESMYTVRLSRASLT
jgi:hypothetical protein